MLLNKILAAYALWRRERQIFRELAALDRRELDDLGISPYQLHDIARNAALAGQ